jgi:capsular exopolysaccharide synthesis family protein
MDIRNILIYIKKWAWLGVLGSILGLLGGYAFTLTQPTLFQTTTKVMISRSPEDRGNDYYYIYSDLQLAKTYTQLIATQPVLDAVGQELGFPVSKGQISIEQLTDMLILNVTVRDQDPQRAQLIANTLIEVFIQQNEINLTSRFIAAEESLQNQIAQIQVQIAGVQDEIAQQSETNLQEQRTRIETEIVSLTAEINQLRDEIPMLSGSTLAEKQDYLALLETRLSLYHQAYQQLVILGDSLFTDNQSFKQSQLETTLNLYQQLYSNLLNNYESIRLARLRSTTDVVQVEKAPLPSNPVQPKPAQNLLIGFFIGLMLAVGIAYITEYLDDTLKTPEDVSRILKLPTIGLIGKIEKEALVPGSAYVIDQPRTPVAESFRSLRTNLEFASVDKPLSTILVTSSGPSEGKSTVAINLAMVIAQSGKKVVLVDADLRRPTLRTRLKLGNGYGLTDLFRFQPPDLDKFPTWGEPPIKVIPSGKIPPNPTELLGSVRMKQILDQLKASYDAVIIDSPPFIVADAVVISARVDGVVLIVEPGKTKIDSSQVMLEQLYRSGARVLGVVLNLISAKTKHYYGKYRHYTYYYSNQSYDRASGKNGGGSESHRMKESQKAETTQLGMLDDQQ